MELRAGLLQNHDLGFRQIQRVAVLVDGRLDHQGRLVLIAGRAGKGDVELGEAGGAVRGDDRLDREGRIEARHRRVGRKRRRHRRFVRYLRSGAGDPIARRRREEDGPHGAGGGVHRLLEPGLDRRAGLLRIGLRDRNTRNREGAFQGRDRHGGLETRQSEHGPRHGRIVGILELNLRLVDALRRRTEVDQVVVRIHGRYGHGGRIALAHHHRQRTQPGLNGRGIGRRGRLVEVEGVLLARVHVAVAVGIEPQGELAGHVHLRDIRIAVGRRRGGDGQLLDGLRVVGQRDAADRVRVIVGIVGDGARQRDALHLLGEVARINVGLRQRRAGGRIRDGIPRSVQQVVGLRPSRHEIAIVGRGDRLSHCRLDRVAVGLVDQDRVGVQRRNAQQTPVFQRIQPQMAEGSLRPPPARSRAKLFPETFDPRTPARHPPPIKQSHDLPLPRTFGRWAPLPSERQTVRA